MRGDIPSALVTNFPAAIPVEWNASFPQRGCRDWSEKQPVFVSLRVLISRSQVSCPIFPTETAGWKTGKKYRNIENRLQIQRNHVYLNLSSGTETLISYIKIILKRLNQLINSIVYKYKYKIDSQIVNPLFMSMSRVIVHVWERIKKNINEFPIPGGLIFLSSPCADRLNAMLRVLNHDKTPLTHYTHHLQ